MKRNLRLPCEARLADGSYLTTVYPSEKDRRHRTGGVRVRVVEYRLEGSPRTTSGTICKTLQSVCAECDPRAAV